MKKTFSLLCIVCFPACTLHAQSWLITGNSGTVPSTNFLGTTDNKGLVFRTNNIERMRIIASGNLGIGLTNPLQKLDVSGNINIGSGFSLFMENRRVLRVDSVNKNIFSGNGTGRVYTTGTFNTVNGYYALSSNTTGYSNTATGGNSLYSNISGVANTANGISALYSNTAGSYNAACGGYALFYNTTGSYNTANGYNALFFNQDGSYNTASGYQALYYNKASYITASGYRALYSNTTGGFNVANGTYSMYNNTTGYSNAAYGYSSLYANTTGFYNTGTGVLALYSNNTGSYNTAHGYRALYANTTGSNNTASGWEALYLNTTGNNNTATGEAALYSCITGNYNTAVGYYALFNTPYAWGNTAVGDIAGASYTNGYYNTFIGAETDATAPDIYNSTALGRLTYVTASSQVRIGNSFVTSIGGYAGWSNISDGRYKKNIKQNVPGLAFINKLHPVTYTLDIAGIDNKLHSQNAQQEKQRKISGEAVDMDVNARAEKSKIVYTGFIAQDVEKAAGELGYNFSGVDAPRNENDLYSLRYAEFVVPIVKAVQELDEANKKLQEQNTGLQKQIDELKQSIQTISSRNGTDFSFSNSSETAAASLEQNTPNPFSSSTTIRYRTPSGTTNAQLMVTNANGNTVKTVTLNNKAAGSVTIYAGDLAAGSYHYTLLIDGKKAGNKQMIVVK